MPDITPQEQEIRPTPTLKEVLLQSSFAKGRELPDSIQEIELRSFGDEARNLISQTLKDPHKREFGKLVYVTNDRKVLIANNETRGIKISEDHFRIEYEVRLKMTNADTRLPWYLRQDRIRAMDIHSHPLDIPQSTLDISYLLLPDSDRSAAAACFVVTPERNILVFRGKGAHQFPREEFGGKKDIWDKAVDDSVDRLLKPGMSMKEIEDISNRARGALLKQVANQHNLKIFTGKLNEGTVKLQK